MAERGTRMLRDTGRPFYKYSMIYFTISLALSTFLAGAIVYQLLKCKFQTQSILGREHGKHYRVLSVLFIESALMNVVCSAFLLLSDIVAVMNDDPTQLSPVWDGMFQIFSRNDPYCSGEAHFDL